MQVETVYNLQQTQDSVDISTDNFYVSQIPGECQVISVRLKLSHNR